MGRRMHNKGFKALTLQIVGLAVLSVVGAGCEITSSEQSEIDRVFASNPGNPGPSQGSGHPAGGSCTTESFVQPAATVSRKLDLLFITDTSGSLLEERAGISAGIDAFVQALPSNVDYRIGVMLAHGSKSARSGRLYQKGSSPLVLDSQTLSLATMRTHLQNNLTNPAMDPYSDGGEESLYSLKRALTTQLASNQAQGFFRNDAALAVVFIADENDICAEYPAEVTPVPDGDGLELPAKALDCAGITPSAIVQLLQARQNGRPLVVAGLIYNRRATVPVGGENEYGYGYVETIASANGLSIDLADGHYQEGLNQIGQLTMEKFEARTEFALSATGFDPSTLQVRVNGAVVPFGYDASLHQIQLQSVHAGGPLSTIEVSYCTRPPVSNAGISELCQAGAFAPKSSIRVGVVADPNEGTWSTIDYALSQMSIPHNLYDDASLMSDRWNQDGTTVLMIARKFVLEPAQQAHVDALRRFVAQGGSVIAEYDGAAWLFDQTQGNSALLANLAPQAAIFSGVIEGGGALLPISASKTIVTDPSHPTMEGLPSEIQNGLRAAFALSGYNAEWLHRTAQFVSTGTGGLVPVGAYPAMLAGRCGAGRVVITTMSHLQTMDQPPVQTWVNNSLRWVTGQL